MSYIPLEILEIMFDEGMINQEEYKQHLEDQKEEKTQEQGDEKMEKRTIRKNVNVSEKVAKWFENKSKETGLSQSALMAIALNNFIKDDETVKNVISIDDFISKMEEIKNIMPEKQAEEKKAFPAGFRARN